MRWENGSGRHSKIEIEGFCSWAHQDIFQGNKVLTLVSVMHLCLWWKYESSQVVASTTKCTVWGLMVKDLYTRNVTELPSISTTRLKQSQDSCQPVYMCCVGTPSIYCDSCWSNPPLNRWRLPTRRKLTEVLWVFLLKHPYFLPKKLYRWRLPSIAKAVQKCCRRQAAEILRRNAWSDPTHKCTKTSHVVGANHSPRGICECHGMAHTV